MAQNPYNNSTVQDANEAIVEELRTLSELKRKFLKRELDLSPQITLMLAEIQEQQSLKKTYEIIIKKLESDVEVEGSEVDSLHKQFKDRLAFNNFVKLIIKEMELANWDLDAAAKAIESGVVFEASTLPIQVERNEASTLPIQVERNEASTLPIQVERNEASTLSIQVERKEASALSIQVERKEASALSIQVERKEASTLPIQVERKDVSHFCFNAQSLNGTMPIPPEFVVNTECASVVNEAYEDFLAQDNALASWLLSTISASLLPQFVGAESASAVWSTIIQFFANKSTTTVMNLHYKLQSIRKGDDSKHVYLTRIKEVCDALASCGSPVSQVEHVVSILKGLPREYQSFMAVITSSSETLSLDRVYSMLVDAETQLAGFDAQPENLPMSASVAQGQLHGGSTRFVDTHDFKQQSSTMRGGRTGARGRARLQFQLCGKNGHSVDQCCVNYVNLDNVACTCCANKNGAGVVSTQTTVAPVAALNSSRTQWIMNSGATHHVTPDATHINHSTDLDGPSNLVVGNGTSLAVKSVDFFPKKRSIPRPQFSPLPIIKNLHVNITNQSLSSQKPLHVSSIENLAISKKTQQRKTECQAYEADRSRPLDINIELPDEEASLEAAKKIKIGIYFVTWWALNVVFNIYNKKVLNAFPFPWLTSTLSLAAGSMLMLISWATRVADAPKTDFEFWKTLFPVAVAHTIGHVAATVSMSKVAVSFTHIIKSGEPAFSVLVSRFLLGEAYPLPVYLSLLPIIGGCALSAFTELNFNRTGLMGAMISNLAFVFRNIFSKKGMNGKSVSGMNYYACLSMLSLLILTPFAIAVEGPQLWTVGWQKAVSQIGPNFVWWVVAQSVFYHLYNQVSYMSLDQISPLTFSIGNTMKRISVIVSSIIIFHTPVQPINALGAAIAILGTFLYSQAKHLDFAYFSDICYKSFGDRVKYWVTFNEPNFQRRSLSSQLATSSYLMQAAVAVNIYRSKYQSLYTLVRVGKQNSETKTASFLDPVVFGGYPPEMQRILGSIDCMFSECELGTGTSRTEGLRGQRSQKNSIPIGEPPGEMRVPGPSVVTYWLSILNQKLNPSAMQTDVDWIYVHPRGMKIINYLKRRSNNIAMIITENATMKPKCHLKFNFIA
ncbi:Glucose-6-phosphate/phosphate translocator 2 [Hibiscus syriacus]|uniref:Glucose-6-phosphate/phosphate translocator 2 n=1 Tax=Hibiscus syriacus TaxID=106335 RepID=A0A6A3BCZ6_HIBSY|nr:Glucose-6-phosphate/phosphate translocator 2 [Hibiscus syriacus]